MILPPHNDPQAHSYELAKEFFRRAFQVALRCATSLVARNQMQPVVMNVIFAAQQRFSGCADGMSSEFFVGGVDEAHEDLHWRLVRDIGNDDQTTQT